ncbi:MAG: orotidine-5'-phosphate decarboxylase, partial [Candidatus Zixiibacteriota bacterium]
GGMEMMRRTVERCQKVAKKMDRPCPVVLAVTILTSLDEGNLKELGLFGPIQEHVMRLAELAQKAGIDGVVASPREIVPIRQRCGSKFLIVTPGIRPTFGQSFKDDQKRFMTAKEAISAGADYLVIGRPIRMAPNPVVAMDKLLEEIR